MTTTVDLKIRPLDDEDQDRCYAFNCGDEVWSAEVNRYIREVRWQKGREKESGLIGMADDAMVGYGVWKHTLASPHDDEVVIRFVFFGVDVAFQRTKTTRGQSTAATLYATLEADAVADEHSTPDMPLELFCHCDNEWGIDFWKRMGYVVVDADTGHDYIRMRVA